MKINIFLLKLKENDQIEYSQVNESDNETNRIVSDPIVEIQLTLNFPHIQK